jgi:pimeloyl-ACP methyl ester carboxylesterase
MEVVRTVEQPYLIIHAELDETVPLAEGKKLASLGRNTTLSVIDGGNHSFGGGHPYDSEILPKQTLEAIKLVDLFIKN